MTTYQKHMIDLVIQLLTAITSGSLKEAMLVVIRMESAIREEDQRRGMINALDAGDDE